MTRTPSARWRRPVRRSRQREAISALGFTFACVLALARPLAGQAERRITLEEAVVTALREGATARVAAAMSEAARQGARESTAALYPALSLESGFLRSSDPVAAFGTKLRQGRFGEADFALPALNDPDPVTDWTAGLRVSWGGLDPAVWASRTAAAREADAARAGETRAREAVRFETTAAYYTAIAAAARLGAADAAVEAARATRDRFARREREGLLTEADLLQAEAELRSAEAARLAARQARDDARRRLGLTLGWAADSVPVPAVGLAPPPEAPGRGGEPKATDGRSDLRALRARASAAQSRVRSAAGSWWPRLEAFGSWTTHAADPLTSDQPEWSVGVGLRWTLFAGFARPAGVARARAEADALRAELDRAEDAAAIEARNAAEGLETARGSWEASRLAAEAARAGRDLMRRRFEEGLAGPSDLLQAEARVADMDRNEVDALAAVHVAVARLRFALGEPASGGTDRGGETEDTADTVSARSSGAPGGDR